MLEAIGWIGATCLALCGLPQALQSIQQKHSHGISHGLIWLWLGGEVLTLIYVSAAASWPLIFNYSANILILAPIAWYKIFPKS